MKIFILSILLSFSHVLFSVEAEKPTSAIKKKSFSAETFFTKDLSFSTNFLTTPALPVLGISKTFKTNEVFEVIIIFKGYTLSSNSAHIVYGIKISDPKGKDYYVNDKLSFNFSNLSTNQALILDPKQFLRIKFTPPELKGKYRVYVFAVDVVSKEKSSQEVFIEHI